MGIAFPLNLDGQTRQTKINQLEAVMADAARPACANAGRSGEAVDFSKADINICVPSIGHGWKAAVAISHPPSVRTWPGTWVFIGKELTIPAPARTNERNEIVLLIGLPRFPILPGPRYGEA